MPVLTQAELEEKLAEIVRRLRETFLPSVIYLFGSYASGNPQPHSDLDLLLVVEDSELSRYQRDGHAYLALIGIPVAIDVMVYTREEFESRSVLPVSFERTVKRKARQLYAA